MTLLLVLPALCLSARAESVRLTWDPSPDPEVTGYILWYGTQSGVYTNATAVGNEIVATASNLVAGLTYYFVVTAHDEFGLESEPSNEVVYKVPLTIPEPDPGATQRGFVTEIGFGTLRNDFSGYVGMQLVVGTGPLTVKSLGRFKWGGNSGTHTVKLVRGSDGIDVPGGTVTVNMASGVAGQYVYTSLATPVVLNAGSTYYLVSLESQGGDAWCSYDTQITGTSVASVRSGVWGNGTGQWYAAGGSGQGYVPVDFQYATSSATGGTTGTSGTTSTEAAYVTGVAPGTWRNNFSGFVGMNIVIGADPLTVTALGRMKVSGNVGSHLVKLVRASDGADVPGGSVVIGTSSGTVGQFQYGRLASPVVLAAGTKYYLMSQETAGGDGWYEYDTTVTTTGVARHESAVWGTGPGQWYPWGGPGQTYVPVDFKHSVVAGGDTPTGGSDTAFVSGVALGTMRNDFSGFVGLKLVIGSQPLTVTTLGRMRFNGNSGVHTVKLVRAADGLDVPGGSAVINMSTGTAGQFNYGKLANPVVLTAGSSYYLLSQEVQGGDAWAEYDTTITTKSVASVPSAAWGRGPGEWYPWGTAGHTYVPVDFKYTSAAEANFVTGQTLGTPRNDFTGFVGMNLVIGNQPLTVTALGRFKLSGNSGTHIVKLVRASDGADVPGGSVTVNLASGTAGQYQYVRLSTPVVLEAGSGFYLMSQETLGGDSWCEYNTQVTNSGVALNPSAVWGYGQWQWYRWGSQGQTYVPVDFKYVLGQ